MIKVLICDLLAPEALKIFSMYGIQVTQKNYVEPDELKSIANHYDALIVRSATKITREILEATTSLKVIGRAGIGVDNIDLAAATEKGIVVMNTPFGNSITTAEHTIAMMLSLARHIPFADASTKLGKWEKLKFVGVEVHGKILGIIGCGNIGSIVAARAQGLAMKVITYDPYLSPERAYDLGVKKVNLAELLQSSDFVTLHTPLTDATTNIIDKDALLLMKETAYLVNCARGGLIDEVALEDALLSGKIAGAAVDVFKVEPARENTLFKLPNFIATPHLSASTTEAQLKVAVQIAEQVSDYLLKGAVANALNMPPITAEEAPRLKPYTALARQIGSFAGQILEGGIQKITIEYEGHVASLNTRSLTTLVLEGLFKPLLSSVNMVNAPLVARQRNIDITEVLHEKEGDYHTLIRLRVETESATQFVAGTLFANKWPRIVSVLGVPIEAKLTPRMLLVTNDDKPGFIGALGSLLGEVGVNIATFNLGRNEEKTQAIALISVDEPITATVLEKVAKLNHVQKVKALSFEY